MLRQLPFKLPYSFEDAVGYLRGFRWVAFFWEPCGDEVMFDDGCCSADGNPWGFLQFIRHRNVAQWLQGYNLGASDADAVHWLLCDLETRDCYIGEKEEVRAHLADEMKKYMPGKAPAHFLNAANPEELVKILKDIRELLQAVPAPSAADIQEKVRREAEATDKMVAELG